MKLGRPPANRWLEALEPRRLMAATPADEPVNPAATVVDLQAVSVNTNLEATAVPGDRGLATVRIANVANEPVDRTVNIAIYATEAGVVDESSFLLGSRQNVAVKLPAAGDLAFADYATAIAITQALGIDQYVLVAVVTVNDKSGEPEEANLQNNTVADDTTLNCEFAFGGFAGRTDVSLTLTQGDGSLVTFRYKGSGGGRVIPGDGYYDILITRASPTTTLFVNTVKGAGGAGSGQSTIRNINFQGAMITGEAGESSDGVAQPADIDPQLMLDKFIAKASRLVGQFNAAGGVKVIQVAEADGATLNIDTSGNPADTLTLTLVQARNLSVDSQIPIRSITTARWLDDDQTPDMIVAPSLGTLKVAGNKALNLVGDFQADLTLDGAGLAVLGTATITGTLDTVDWNIAGGAKSLKFAAVGDAELVFAGNIATLSAASWLDGALAAQAIKTLKIPGAFAADLTLLANSPTTLVSAALGTVSGQWNVAGTTGRLTLAAADDDWRAQFGSLARFTVGGELAGEVSVNNAGAVVAGSMRDLELRAVGNITSIRTASMTDALVFLGVNGNGDDLPDALGDYADSSATLGSLTLTAANSFSNSKVAAGFVRMINLREVDTTNDGTELGLAARVIDALARVVNGSLVRLVDLDVPGDSFTDGDFVVRVFG
jgi:hypothetical protein